MPKTQDGGTPVDRRTDSGMGWDLCMGNEGMKGGHPTLFSYGNVSVYCSGDSAGRWKGCTTGSAPLISSTTTRCARDSAPISPTARPFAPRVLIGVLLREIVEADHVYTVAQKYVSQLVALIIHRRSRAYSEACSLSTLSTT
jgi:hypothetical protein